MPRGLEQSDTLEDNDDDDDAEISDETDNINENHRLVKNTMIEVFEALDLYLFGPH